MEDYLGWLGDRLEIGAALLYVESIEDHERFREVARRVSATKPVIALFGGRTGIGGQAATAHTGAVANDDAAIDAFCASCGIIRVKSLRRLLVAAEPGCELGPGGKFGDTTDFREKIIRQRHTGERRARLERRMHGIRDVPNLNHLAHASSMKPCAGDVKGRPARSPLGPRQNAALRRSGGTPPPRLESR